MNDLELPRGEKTRRQIIQVAHELFIKQGYHGTSMRQIAQKAELALSSLYNHFPGKEDVYLAVFHEYHPIQEILPALSMAEGNTIEAFLRDALEKMTSAFDKRPHFLNLMFIETVEFKNSHIADIFLTYFPKIIQITQNLFQNNLFRLQNMPLPMFARTFMGMLFAFYLTEVFFASKAPPDFCDGAQEYFMDVYLHGILTDKDSSL